MEKEKRLSVKEASEILDTTPDVIRRGISEGRLPIGTAVPSDSGEREHFLIYESKIKAYMENRETEEAGTIVPAELFKKVFHDVENAYLILREMIS